jgi:coproporphyrinogen III oxidase-like Fe-S oxidoreductase
MLEEFIRSHLRRILTKEKNIVFEQKTLLLERSFQNINELGIYLHIPFCEQICPYCPYNKEIYDSDVARRYTQAVKREIDFYSDLIGNTPVTSFYIGGGTPTTMLYSGLEEILDYVFNCFKMRCDIHMESHPNHLSSDNLNTIASMGIDHLSIGVESLQDRHLRTLNRPYSVKQAMEAVGRAVGKGFKCVNADMIFALPDQTLSEVEQAGQVLVDLGLDQVAAYPLFIFPYTKMKKIINENNYRMSSIFKRRKMLGILEGIFYGADYRRTSVWAFTRPSVPKYCSVTVPVYIGLGASGGSYLKDVFYLNTFRVAEYINALEEGRMPTALSLDLSENLQMAGWLYWRIYETRFLKKDFRERFGKDFDKIYGIYFKLLSLLGFLIDEEDQIVLSDKGTYWLHVLEDQFSLDYINKVWGSSKYDPWPSKVAL